MPSWRWRTIWSSRSLRRWRAISRPLCPRAALTKWCAIFSTACSSRGLRLEDYIKYMGGDTAKFREGFKEQG